MNADQLYQSLRKLVWDNEQCSMLAHVVKIGVGNSRDSVKLVRSGLILQGVIGGGKTTLLKLIQNFTGEKCVLIDCSTLSLSDRYAVFALFIILCADFCFPPPP
jgi:hypothetical protein